MVDALLDVTCTHCQQIFIFIRLRLSESLVQLYPWQNQSIHCRHIRKWLSNNELVHHFYCFCCFCCFTRFSQWGPGIVHNVMLHIRKSLSRHSNSPINSVESELACPILGRIPPKRGSNSNRLAFLLIVCFGVLTSQGACKKMNIVPGSHRRVHHKVWAWNQHFVTDHLLFLVPNMCSLVWVKMKIWRHPQQTYLSNHEMFYIEGHSGFLFKGKKVSFCEQNFSSVKLWVNSI